MTQTFRSNYVHKKAVEYVQAIFDEGYPWATDEDGSHWIIEFVEMDLEVAFEAGWEAAMREYGKEL